MRAFRPSSTAALALDFEFHDLAHVQGLVGAAPPDGVALPLPPAAIFGWSSRRSATTCPMYWGAAESRVGAVSVERYVRAASLDERALFLPAVGSPIQAIFLQPMLGPVALASWLATSTSTCPV